jgi:hypothetical protein
MDAIVIHFRTDLFDVSKETPNEINPIYGESVLNWLADKLRDQVSFPKPEPEDWGWSVNIDWHGHKYMLGAASDEDPNAGEHREWSIQILKHRSVVEKLLGNEKMSPADSFAEIVQQIIRTEPAFESFELDDAP